MIIPKGENLNKGEGARPIESVEFNPDNYIEAAKLYFGTRELKGHYHLVCFFCWINSILILDR